MIVRWLVALALLVTQSPALAAQETASPCRFATADRAWLDRAMDAWDLSVRELTHLRVARPLTAILFDADCVLTSRTAMSGGARHWSSAPHAGSIRLPDGQSIPAKVTSFTASGKAGDFFVMAAPSVWRPGKVDGGPLGLETLMVAVLLHEGSHVAQIGTYGDRMRLLSGKWHLPESFNDDSIQERFGGNREFAASVAAETDLLLRSAAAPERGEAVRLAREARGMMRTRQARWYRASRYLAEAEDIWLTMEGSGQWAGDAWLKDPSGGGLSDEQASRGFGLRGKWWSQREGFALFQALTRLTGRDWQRHAYGDGRLTALQMLDAAIGEPAKASRSAPARS